MKLWHGLVAIGVVVVAGAIVYVYSQEEMPCNRVIQDQWLKREVKTAHEFEQEVEAMLPDKSCGGITPADLRKVIRDAQRIPPLTPVPAESGLGNGFGHHLPRGQIGGSCELGTTFTIENADGRTKVWCKPN